MPLGKTRFSKGARPSVSRKRLLRRLRLLWRPMLDYPVPVVARRGRNWCEEVVPGWLVLLVPRMDLMRRRWRMYCFECRQWRYGWTDTSTFVVWAAKSAWLVLCIAVVAIWAVRLVERSFFVELFWRVPFMRTKVESTMLWHSWRTC